MNTTASPRSHRYVQGRFQPVLAVAMGITLIASIGLTAGGDNPIDEGRFFVAPDPPAAANVADYRSAEQQGMVPDEYAGGFRPARNLRERLQAARGDYSASLR